jgi:hypothetical protein
MIYRYKKNGPKAGARDGMKKRNSRKKGTKIA